MNSGCVYDDALLERQGLTAYLPLPLTNEGLQAPQDFKQALDNAIKAIPSRDLMPSDAPALLELITAVKKNSAIFSEHGAPKYMYDQAKA